MPIFPISPSSVPCACITRLRVVLQLMKHLRQKELLRCFRGLAGFFHGPSNNPELERNTMSVARKLIAQGRVEGLWIGKIQIPEEFLDLPVSSGEGLESGRTQSDARATSLKIRAAFQEALTRTIGGAGA